MCHPVRRRAPKPFAVTFESADALRLESSPVDVHIYARDLAVLERLADLGAHGPLASQHEEVAQLIAGLRNDDSACHEREGRHILVMGEWRECGKLHVWAGRRHAWEETVAALAEYPRRLGEFSPSREGGRS